MIEDNVLIPLSKRTQYSHIFSYSALSACDVLILIKGKTIILLLQNLNQKILCNFRILEEAKTTMKKLFLIIFLTILTLKTVAPSDDAKSSEEKLEENEHDYLVQVEYIFKSDKLAKLIQHEIWATPLEEIDQNLSLIDILEFIKVKNMTLDQFMEILDQLNLKKQHLSAQGIAHLTQGLNISISEVLLKFKETFKKQSEEPIILQIFQIDLASFYGMNFNKNDTELLKILAKGNYSKDTLSEAKKVLKLTDEDIFNFTRSIVVEKLYQNHTMKEMLQCISSWNAKNAIENILNIMHINFETLTTSPKLIEFLDSFQKRLSQDIILGVKIGKREIITHGKVYHTYSTSKEFIEMTTGNVDLTSSYNITEVKQLKWGNAILKTDKDLKFVKIVDHVDRSHPIDNCKYVSGTFFEAIISENVAKVTINDNGLEIRKTNKTVFRLGSPLMCNGDLYGLANQETEDKIYFTLVSETRSSASKAPLYGIMSFMVLLYFLTLVK